MSTTTTRRSEPSLVLLVTLLLTLGATALGATEAPDSVPLPDPYGLGERLVIIDDLRQRGLAVPEQADLLHLRQAWWQAHHDPADDRLIAVEPSDPASLRSKLDQLRRRNDQLRQQVANLERRLRDHLDLQRRYQRLRAHVVDDTPLDDDTLNGLVRPTGAASAQAPVDAESDAVIVTEPARPAQPASADPPATPVPTTEPPAPQPVPDLPPIHLDAPRPLPADFPDPPSTPAAERNGDENNDADIDEDGLPLWWLLMPVALIAITGLGLIARRGRDLHRHTARVIAHRLPEANRFDRLCLPIDGETLMIDHLVLLPSGLVMIQDVPINGELHARSADALWARIHGGQREAFPNPLRQRERLLSLIADITGCQRLHLHFFIVLPASCRLLTGSLDHVGSADAVVARLASLGPPVLSAKQQEEYAERLRQAEMTMIGHG